MSQFHTSDGRILRLGELPLDSTDIYIPRILLSPVDIQSSYLSAQSEFQDVVISASGSERTNAVAELIPNSTVSKLQSTKRKRCGTREPRAPEAADAEIKSEASKLPEISKTISFTTPIKLEPKHEFTSELEHNLLEINAVVKEERPRNAVGRQEPVTNTSAAMRAAFGLRPKSGAINYGGYWLANYSGEENSDTDVDSDYEHEPIPKPAKISASTTSRKRRIKIKDPTSSSSASPLPRIPQECRTCNVQFPTKAELKAHWKTKEHAKRLTGKKRNEDVYPCSFCGKIFQRRKARNEHEGTHKAYFCKICGNRFSQEGQVNIHMRIHSGEMPYQCSTCKKRFNQKTHLQRHMKIHSRDLPFSCDKCTMRFNQKCNLVRHLNSHAAGRLRHLSTK